ncbi:MAG TPA: hypothetical protein VF824_22680 [Thermoanaerobaculia bacterium]|jgi:hypothetical protein
MLGARVRHFGGAVSTRCQTASSTTMNGGVPVRILLGCGDGFADDVLWHLDRID